MKLSEAIRKLQASLEIFGDDELAFSCDELEEDEPRWIDGIGSYVDDRDPANPKRYALVVCGTCHHQAMADKHMFDYEPSPDCELLGDDEPVGLGFNTDGII